MNTKCQLKPTILIFKTKRAFFRTKFAQKGISSQKQLVKLTALLNSADLN